MMLVVVVVSVLVGVMVVMVVAAEHSVFAFVGGYWLVVI